jgi:hypothetical protein
MTYPLFTPTSSLLISVRKLTSASGVLPYRYFLVRYHSGV